MLPAMLPHEKILSERSIRLNELELESEQSSRCIAGQLVGSSEKDDIKTKQKEDIYISTNINNESMRSIRQLMSMKEESSLSCSLYSPKSCPICIETYQVGEEIAWSKNENCHHAFHLDCIMTWLMKSDDCPLCRANYLLSDDHEPDNNV